MPTPRRKFSYIAGEIPTEEYGVEVGDQWIDTAESPPTEKVCTSLNPITFTILAQEYILPGSVVHSVPVDDYKQIEDATYDPTTKKLKMVYKV